MNHEECESWTSSHGNQDNFETHDSGDNDFPHHESEVEWNISHDDSQDSNSGNEFLYEDHYGSDEDQDSEHERDINEIIDRDETDEEEHEFFGPGMSSRDFMNTLRQHMRNNEHRSGTHEVHDENGRMNLSEVLPELLSMMGSAGDAGLRNRSDANSRSARMAKLVDNVENAESDPYFAMESIIELSENLLMVNQIIIERIFPIKRLLHALVNILGSFKLRDELELQLQCCRCLYNIFEVHPESMSVAVDKDIIQFLQSKLTEISYIDLAEQVLETLELLSRLCGRDILHNGQLSSYIQYFDFFTIHAQRKSVAIIANACAIVKNSDFETIEDLFLTLKPIFVNCTDQTIVSRLLDTLYGICGGIKDVDMLESLFTTEITQHLIELISNSDTALDGKLKCLDILALIVSHCPKIAHTILKSPNLSITLEKCLYQYGKNSNASLHETIMFVPKNLLNSISRFLVLLFPPEVEQLLTVKNTNFRDNNTDFFSNFKEVKEISHLLEKLIPMLCEIYINTINFSTRRNVLIGLTRIATYMNTDVAKYSVDYFIKLLGASLAQSKNFLENGTSNPYEVGVLIIGLLSIVKVLERNFLCIFTIPFKKEGIYDTIKSINQDVLKFQEKNEVSSNQEPEFSDREYREYSDELDQNTEHEEEEEEEDNIYLDDRDIPKEVLPRKLKFKFLNKLTSGEMLDIVVESAELILSMVDSSGEITYEEDEMTKNMVKTLEEMHVDPGSYDDVYRFLLAVNDCIFQRHTVLSGFELVSNQLPTIIANKLSELNLNWTTNLQSAVKTAFGDNLVELIKIFQSALTRVESFSIIDSGLQGEERGMESLGKQIKIHLHYDGDSKTFTPLSTIVVSVHCIASFKVLETFIKDRAVRAKIFSLIIPTSSDEGSGENNGESFSNAKSIKESVLKFYYNDEEIDSKDTIFGALFKILYKKEDKNVRDLWNDIQNIHFKIYEKDNTKIVDLGAKSNPEDEDYDMENEEGDEEKEDPLCNIYDNIESFGSETNQATEDIMKVLRVLRVCFQNDDYFVNSKLSAKLARQLDEPLVIVGGVLPEWTLRLTKEYSFLFPFESRMFFLQCTSFGYGRLIQLWKDKLTAEKQLSSDDPLLQLGRLSRSKILISRENMLLAALRIMDDYSNSAAVLEFQYTDEEGSGLGPTLEFYSTISKDFAQKKLNLWRTSNFDEGNDYVTGLLYPKPVAETDSQKQKIVELFDYLGTFIARSLLDNRIVDFRFNSVFFRLANQIAAGKSYVEYNNIEDGFSILKLVDKSLTQSLRYIYNHKDNKQVIEEMCLTFVLPGSDIELIKNGSKLNVHVGNVTQYIRSIISYIIDIGVKDQIKSFISGFSKVFPYSNLIILTPEELVELFGRVEEDWSTETLYTCITANHGYTMDSATIHNLISIMSSFNLQERRAFLQFITGSPKLPLGGFKALKPKLTVVLKHAESGLTPDEYLPSVMTCANYLKLPKYSSKEIMQQRITQAIHEGAGAFLLS
ncbi:hypothetical protein RI543_005179 [Arxiozyma heterogenica]|uniref:HECT-type E3 ubiquitin transferase n=1 Tax=Arxiozyma heterogenica TaxID=278026 RepID=A0AAN8A723_9SACH|nr:hypothetical protein RI543_005179 [Kazachstania heterogenica]